MLTSDGPPRLERLRREGLSAVEELYLEWRNDFIAFAGKYTASEADVLDAYQDAVVILYENVASGRLTELTSSLKTYLFSIGKYTLLAKLKKNKKTVIYEPDINESVPAVEPEEALNERQAAMLSTLKGMGNRCQQIIELYYFHRHSIREIVSLTGLKNENTVKAQKSRCLKSLKEKLVNGA